MAARLVRGCDLWINLPRPPLEASGTSGMKAVINGGLNLSVLDGWWAEAYDGANGWALPGDVDPDHAAQDERDAAALYGLLEQEVAPLFYDRDADGIPALLARARPRVDAHARAGVLRRAHARRLRRADVHAREGSRHGVGEDVRPVAGRRAPTHEAQPARRGRKRGAVVSSANCSPVTPVTNRPPRIRPRASRRRRAQRTSRHGTASRSLR